MKKITLLFSFCLLFLTNAKSQCAANFSVAISANGNVSFINLSSGTSSLASYYWDFGDGQNSYNVSNPSHIYGGNGTYTVSLFLTDSTNTCNSNITHTLAITNVTCNVTAGLSLNISNSYVTFSNTSTGTIPSTSYSLSYGNGNGTSFSNNNFNSIGYPYTVSGNYTITLTAVNSSVNCSNTFTTVINVIVPPCNLNANFSYTVNNGTVSFSNLTTGASTLASYYWYFGGPGFSGPTPPPQNFLNGQYVVSLMVQDSVLTQCSSSTSQTINVSSAPCTVNTSFAMAKDSSVTSSIVWNAYPVYPLNTSAVSWSWGDGSSSAGLYPSHTYSAAGMYNVCMSVTVSCGSFTTICLNSNINKGTGSQIVSLTVVNPSGPTGIAENKKSTSLFIYPNPAKDQLTLEGLNAAAQITITDLLGKTIFLEIQKENKSVIDVSGLNPGIYIIKASGSTINATTKLIKE